MDGRNGLDGMQACKNQPDENKQGIARFVGGQRGFC